MSDQTLASAPRASRRTRVRPAGEAALAGAASYALALLFVLAAALLAFVVERLAGPADLSLIFVLPVVVSAIAFGWRPALSAGVAGVLVFDFFFLEPRYTLRVADPAGVLSLALLLAIAAIVSTVAVQSRRRALAVEAALDQVRALETLAQACAAAGSQDAALAAAATALQRIFHAPAVIYARRELTMAPVATAGAPQLTPAEDAAARWALGAQVHAHAESYPHDASTFDFWPVGEGLVLGVDLTRAAQPTPDNTQSLVAVVAALALGRACN